MTMIHSENEQKVCDIVAEILSVERGKVHINSKLALDLGADSIDIIDIFFKIESEFNIKIDINSLPAELRKSRSNLIVADFDKILDFSLRK